MTGAGRKNGLSRCRSGGEFIGRDEVLADVIRHSTDGSGGLALLAEPGSGATELLFQTFDRLFFEAGGVIPVYFSFAKCGRADELAARFVRAIINQTIAFRNTNGNLLRAGASVEESLRLAPASDAPLLRGLWKYHAPQADLRDSLSQPSSANILLSRAFDAAARASAAGLELALLLDDLHAIASQLGFAAFQSLVESLDSGGVRYVMAGYRRFLYNAVDVRSRPVSRLGFPEAAQATSAIGARFGIQVRDDVRDLIAEQLRADLPLIEAYFRSASNNRVMLTDFRSVEQHYLKEIFGGRCAKVIDRRLSYAVRSRREMRAVQKVANDLGDDWARRIPLDSVVREIGLKPRRAERLFDRMKDIEFFNFQSGRISVPAGNSPQKDRLRIRYKLEIAGENRALLFGQTLLTKIRDAARVMERRYRSIHCLGITDLLEMFTGREAVPAALLDYGKFASEYRGAPDREVIRDLRNGPFISLPNIVFATATEDIYPPIANSLLREMSAIGFGLVKTSDGNRREEIWLAAELGSKLEVDREEAEFWCDRLEMAAVMSGLSAYRIWLISPQGFDDEALAALTVRGAIGSSRRQAELLRRFLAGQFNAAEPEDEAELFEITIPMDENAELIAAGIAEELAKRHNFDAKSINQIKTALIEAFINAAEHSYSPDRKVHQQFLVNDRKFSVVISNRGIRLTDSGIQSNGGRAKRRGWGLELMRRLMDEVKIEETDDGTRIRMTKFAGGPA